MPVSDQGRRLPVGAEITADGVHARVWAPKRRQVEVVIEGGPGEGAVVRLDRDSNGYFSGLVPGAVAGSRYRYRLDGEDRFPDPASRFQPDGPHGPSEVIDPAAFRWTDQGWPGVTLPGQVIAEIHLGTFTPEGTWRSAMRELPYLKEVGITVVELMPVAEFPGRFGWGYDGVDLFAPTRLYGRPDDARRFVDRAHGLGIAVILDVVYNHLGPDGNYLRQFSDHYFTDRYSTEWGEPLNFDGDQSEPVRELFIANAGYWIDEFHLDGLRLDATQAMFDGSADHIIAAITRRVREAAGGRQTIIVAENELQQTHLVRPAAAGGYGLDGLWNDDFHHTASVALTGRNEAYYSDYYGTPQEFISALKFGYLYQGQWYHWQQQRRGSPAFDVPPAAFITFIENHDQIANSAAGRRLHQLASPGRYRAMTALLLLGPNTPMLFQGQEFASSAPFLYFADHHPELAALVRAGRIEFLRQFPSLAEPSTAALVADPGDPHTFERCKLDLGERLRNAGTVQLHRDLLTLRREDPVFRLQRQRQLDGAVLGDQAFVLRFFGDAGDDRLLVVNFGRELHLEHLPEPLLAPIPGCSWRNLWTSDDVRYGGSGSPPLESIGDGWHIPGEAAIVLVPEPIETIPVG